MEIRHLKEFRLMGLFLQGQKARAVPRYACLCRAQGMIRHNKQQVPLPPASQHSHDPGNTNDIRLVEQQRENRFCNAKETRPSRKAIKLFLQDRNKDEMTVSCDTFVNRHSVDWKLVIGATPTQGHVLKDLPKIQLLDTACTLKSARPGKKSYQSH